jgi:hypothetical protein
MPLFEFGLKEFDFDGGQLPLKNPDQEVAASAGGLQKTRVDSVGLAFDEVQHRVHEPSRCENFAMVGNALLRSNQTQSTCPFRVLNARRYGSRLAVS